MTNSEKAPRPIYSAERCPFVIEHDPAVIAQIGREVVTGFHALPHGGLEVGGLLLGSFSGDLLRIEASEPFSCSYASGPTFTLSDTDKLALAERLRELAAAGDPGESRVVGWYRSHSRGDLALAPQDLAIYQSFFSENWQVALVLKPGADGPTRAGYFFREGEDGVTRTSTPYVVFEIEGDVPAAPAPAPPLEDSAPRHEVVHREELPLPSPPAGGAPARIVVVPRGQRKPTPAWVVWGALAALAALAVSGVYLTRKYSVRSQPVARFVRINAEQKDRNLEVAWDAKALAGARRGTLTIQDGGIRAQLLLDERALASGKLSYAYKSDVTGFHLRVERNDGTAWEGSATYVGSPLSVEPPAVEQPRQEEPPRDQPKDVTAAPQPAPSEPSKTVIEVADRAKPEPPPRKEPRLFTIEMKPASRPAAADPAIVEPPPAVQTAVNAPQAGVQLPRIAPPKPTAPPPTTPAAAATPPAVPAPKPQPPRIQLAGSWALQPNAPSTSPSPPEFVNLTVTESNGTLQGTLYARYRGKTGRLQFSFAGRAGSGTVRLPWTSPEGERGQIEFIRVPGSPDRVEVVWYGADPNQVFDHIVRRVN